MCETEALVLALFSQTMFTAETGNYSFGSFGYSFERIRPLIIFYSQILRMQRNRAKAEVQMISFLQMERHALFASWGVSVKTLFDGRDSKGRFSSDSAALRNELEHLGPDHHFSLDDMVEYSGDDQKRNDDETDSSDDEEYDVSAKRQKAC